MFRVPCRAGYGLPEYRIRFRNTGLPDGRIRKGLSQQGSFASAAVVSQHVGGGFPKTENYLYHFFCRLRIPASLPWSPRCRLTSMRPDWTTCRLTRFGSHPAYQICCRITAGLATRYAAKPRFVFDWGFRVGSIFGPGFRLPCGVDLEPPILGK